MATITRENISTLNDKIIVKIGREDYLSSFEKSLKNYSKSASLPGFRKGMVPAGLVKKMHGQAVFTDEVLKTVEKELTKYMVDEKLDIFAQPLPLAENDARQLDVNNPAEYTFGFEVGLKPEFTVADLAKEKITQYVIEITEDMVNQQVERLQKGYGKKKDPEGGEEDDNIEKAEVNEDLFKMVYPGKDITTEADFRAEIKKEIEAYWQEQAKNHAQHEIYHKLLDHSNITFPESFLKRWLENSGEQQKTAEEVEKEFPGFINQLKWSLINDKISQDQKIEVDPEDLREFAKKQLFGYMGIQNLGGEQQPWLEDYLNKMMQDRKFIEDSYHRIRTDKVFEWADSQVQKEEKSISVEDFTKMLEEHQHHHH